MDSAGSFLSSPISNWHIKFTVVVGACTLILPPYCGLGGPDYGVVGNGKNEDNHLFSDGCDAHI